ncbi:hypothetical protein ACWEPL_51205 [Nonomuraea sp. NPDC004186]
MCQSAAAGLVISPLQASVLQHAPAEAAGVAGGILQMAQASQGDLRPADWTTIGLVEDDFGRFEGRWLIARRKVSPIAGLVAAGSPAAAAGGADSRGLSGNSIILRGAFG